MPCMRASSIETWCFSSTHVVPPQQFFFLGGACGPELRRIASSPRWKRGESLLVSRKEANDAEARPAVSLESWTSLLYPEQCDAMRAGQAVGNGREARNAAFSSIARHKGTPPPPPYSAHCSEAAAALTYVGESIELSVLPVFQSTATMAVRKDTGL
ncbi:uncharacterized protein F4812DRAFT_380857 [Daldinia caldariorum]|uniref:uncharacterized protein n=1 Tax=Daldinia caldariorum TaxID=326644 RepID=UPI002007E08F|nr:uncharacterized protein F4812DRAFT_380857 [Daldinia caldariorum]KAI1467873.1 hypothetical protein F4812DRAFT_380857 [Daldinia caldariorum]